MATNNLSAPSEANALPSLTVLTMFRLGLFQMGLGMMSVLVFGVLNRVLIRELGVPATLGGLVLALTLFVAPARVVFGQLSDTKPLWGSHRTNYVRIGVIALAVLSILCVQVMWQVGDSLQAAGWTAPTYGWIALLGLLFALHGMATSACSTPFATLLVDVSDEENRSKLVAIDWSMLIGGTIVGAITIGVLLKKLTLNSSIDVLQSAINRLIVIVPIFVIALAFIATWGVEKTYSRYRLRSALVNSESKITLNRAWRILTASPQTRLFFTFLILMTIGLFMQDPVLENYGGDVFNMEIGQTASLNAFWGTGTLVGIVAAGFWLTPRVGKRNTAKLGCWLVGVSLIGVILAGFTHSQTVLTVMLLIFGLFSGVTTTGAISMMLDLTAAETAGTFIGAWGLAQALARGVATVTGGSILDLGKTLTNNNLVLSYGLVFACQIAAMVIAVRFLSRVDVQEFRTSSKVAIARVLEVELD